MKIVEFVEFVKKRENFSKFHYHERESDFDNI